jgi:protein dithiol:quinone oxidoreductase
MITLISNAQVQAKKVTWLLISCMLACVGVLLYALYLQHYQDLAPCPLCVMQRYAFMAVGVLCALALLLRATGRIVFTALASIAALVGIAIAGHHLWVKAHPGISCGIDPLETALNKLWLADWLPKVFYADGLCSAEHPAILGLSIPQWSLTWFVTLALALLWSVSKSLQQKRHLF